MCKWSFCFFFSPPLTNPLFRFQPLVADRLSCGLVNIPALIPLILFSPSLNTAQRPDWKVVECIWFENPNILPNIGIAECRWTLSSHRQCVGDTSPSPHDEPHRYGTMNAVVGFEKCVIIKTSSQASDSLLSHSMQQLLALSLCDSKLFEKPCNYSVFFSYFLRFLFTRWDSVPPGRLNTNAQLRKSTCHKNSLRGNKLSFVNVMP